MSIDGQTSSSITLMMGFMICHHVFCPCQSQTTFIYVAAPFRKFSLYVQLASQLSRGVLIDISCTNCDNVSSHCHIMFTGTWSRSVTIVTSVMWVWWRNVQRTEGGHWLLSVSGVKHRRAPAHWSLSPVPTMHRRNSGVERAPGPGPGEGHGSGHHRDQSSGLFVIVL